MTVKKSADLKWFALLSRIANGIGQIAAPIGAKLPVAFLIVVCFMVALALTGMAELRKANDRADQLLEDQIRISTLLAVQRSILTVKLVGADAILNFGNAAENEKLGKKLYDEVYLFRAGASQTGNPNRATHFLTPQYEKEFIANERRIEAAASKIRTHLKEGNAVAAKAVYDTEFSNAVDELDRIIFSIYFNVRERMQDSTEENNRAYERAQTLLVGASGFAIVLALLLGFAISRSITNPLDRIRVALSRLSVGNFETRVSVANRDELGELAGHVNGTSQKLGELYSAIEAQKVELASLNSALEDKVQTQVKEIERTNRLRRFLPAQVAEMIVGAPDEQNILRTQRSEITVLFADLRGFTAYSNAATPDQVVDALNCFHGTCGPLIEASGGTLERFLGDGLMVLFGAPVAMENAAQRAVDLALELRSAVQSSLSGFKSGLEKRSLGIGIGVGTGAATMGQIGFEGRRDYSAIGPAPNLAARLCDVAEDGQILISHATAWQVDAAMEPTGPFDLKGVGPAVAAFKV